MTAPCPLIAIFVQSAGPALAHPWIARFVTTEAIGKKRYLACLPMIFAAATEEGAESAARDWWRIQQIVEQSRLDRVAKAQAARRNPRQNR